MARIAIIGSGLAGLACAHLLHPHHEVTVFEREPEAGGGARSIEVFDHGSGRPLLVELGLRPFSRAGSPQLTRWCDLLRLTLRPSPQSFSIRDDLSGWQWRGEGVPGWFVQPGNLARPSFWRMLRTMRRFHRHAESADSLRPAATLRLPEWARAHGYDTTFYELYLAPLVAATWRATPEQMLEFPAPLLLERVRTELSRGPRMRHPQWTVDGGGRALVQAALTGGVGRLRLGTPVARVVRTGREVVLILGPGNTAAADHVIFATSPTEARRLLVNPTRAELNGLSAFTESEVDAVVHTDTRVMPVARTAWSTEHWEIRRTVAGPRQIGTHRWLNPGSRVPCFCSLGPAPLLEVDPDRVLRTVRHRLPVFTGATVERQASLPALNTEAAGSTRTYFAGNYFGSGRTEDAVASALAVCRQLLGRPATWPG